MDKKPKSNGELLLQYSGFAVQLLIAIGVAVYTGLYIDKWINTKFPIFLWVLPLVVIAGMIFKAIKDTSKKQ